MNSDGKILVSLDGVSERESDQLADDLEKEFLRNGLQVHRQREDEATMDFGATLVLVLGAPAVVIAAKALRDWVTRKNAGAIVRKPDGEILVKGLESKDIAAVTEAINRGLVSKSK
jgi:hypothetical protein